MDSGSDPLRLEGPGLARTPSPGSELGARAVHGIRWTGATRAVAEVVAFAGSVVLARFVAPAEFGRVAAALTIVGIGPAFLSQAFGAPLIQARSLRRGQLQTAALLSPLGGVTLGIVMVVFVWAAIGPVLGERIAYLAFLAIPAVATAALASVPRAMLQRQLAFKSLAVIEIGALMAGTTTSTLLATVGGLDGEALVLGFVAASAVTAALCLALAPRIAPHWGGEGSATALLRFGIPAGLSSVVYSVSRNIDYLVLAGRLRPADVGFYWRGFTMGVEYQSKLSIVMLKIAFPIYARAASIDDIRRYRLRVMATHAAALFPLLAILLVTAPVLIPWLFGERWEPSVIPTQILSGAGMAVALITGTGPFLFAIAKPKALLVYNVAALAGLGLTAYLAAPLGLNGVSAAVLGFYCLLLLANHYFLLHRIGGISKRDLWADALPPLVACLPLVAVTYPLVRVLGEMDTPAPVILLAATALAFATYFVALGALFPSSWRALRMTLDRVVGLDRRARRASSQGRDS
jgi:lipopolysaccharide exporter